MCYTIFVASNSNKFQFITMLPMSKFCFKLLRQDDRNIKEIISIK